MEEKQTMTDEELKACFQSLRSRKLIFTILTYGCGAGMMLMFITGMFPVAIIFLVAALICSYQLSTATSTHKKMLSDNIINSVIHEALGEDVEYNPWGKINPGSMVFPFSYNTTMGSDYIKAVYNGLNIELGDIELIYEEEYTDEEGHTENTSSTKFKGQWLTCDFGKELAGEVYISEWGKKDRRHMKSNVTMDNEQFARRFCVRADNPQEAYYILTPNMMEYIISMADKSGGIVYLSFLRDGRMHVAVKSGRDFFELGKGNADVEYLRQKFLDELHWFTDIVDTLRIENTIYKRAEINE